MGKYDWMLDVLTDIENYARLNDLPCIAHEVERARNTAEEELTTRKNIAAADNARQVRLFGNRAKG